jgi:hypothetical protein
MSQQRWVNTDEACSTHRTSQFLYRDLQRKAILKDLNIDGKIIIKVLKRVICVDWVVCDSEGILSGHKGDFFWGCDAVYYAGNK